MSVRTVLPFLIALSLILGLLALAFWMGAFQWVGHLPGDVSAERDGVRVFVPFTSIVILSILLGVVVQILARWIGR